MATNIDIHSWYSEEGPDDDIIISTRARLARNLADFLFPAKMTADDAHRIQSLIYDAASFNPNYTMIDLESLSSASRRLLKDKNMLSGKVPSALLFSGDKEESFCLINESDHLKIVEFSAGFACEEVARRCYQKDELFQQKLQFAGSFEFGYLTSRLGDLGSGLKISLRVFIPSIVLSGKIKELSDQLNIKNCSLTPLFPSVSNKADFSNFLFDIYPQNAFSGSEIDQIAQIEAAGKYVLKTERKISAEFADNNATVVLNFFRQGYAKAMHSLLLSYDEAVDIISCVKWGLSNNLISGISHEELNSMYYATKDGYLDYLCNSYPFEFEPDVKSDIDLQLKRLRAVVIQQTFEGITNEKSVS
ncbi:MAG: hypothetical protein K5681_05700 [Treponema sp.]|nr:hypothetical protein [Treponema sp.]